MKYERYEGDKLVEEYEISLTDEQTAAINELKDKEKRQTYQGESDPLFFRWQRGDATKQEWLDKVEEINKRFS